MPWAIVRLRAAFEIGHHLGIIGRKLVVGLLITFQVFANTFQIRADFIVFFLGLVSSDLASRIISRQGLHLLKQAFVIAVQFVVFRLERNDTALDEFVVRSSIFFQRIGYFLHLIDQIAQISTRGGKFRHIGFCSRGLFCNLSGKAGVFRLAGSKQQET